VAPRTPTEEAITRIFAEILEVPRVSAEASFFSIGGSSLLAMRAIGLIGKELGVRLRLRNLYGNATMSSLAAAIDDMARPRSG
jgi:acyl carrier protein